MKNTNKKENKKLIETMEFDDYAFAQATRDEAEKKLNRIKIALPISLITTICYLIIMQAPDISDFLAIPIVIGAFGGMIASYILGGGLKIMLSFTKKLAFVGWFILPFPADIATGIVTLCCAPIILLAFPTVFVFANFIQVRRNMKDAEAYMSFCRPVEVAA